MAGEDHVDGEEEEEHAPGDAEGGNADAEEFEELPAAKVKGEEDDGGDERPPKRHLPPGCLVDPAHEGHKNGADPDGIDNDEEGDECVNQKVHKSTPKINRLTPANWMHER